jgi:hypothetical protein
MSTVVNELDDAKSELGALAPDESPCAVIRLPRPRAPWVSSRSLAHRRAHLSRVPICCCPSTGTRRIFWLLVPCIALAWAWLLSGLGSDGHEPPADDAVVVALVEVSLVEAPAEGERPKARDASVPAVAPEEAAPAPPASEPARDGTASFRAASSHDRSSAGLDLPPGTPARPLPADRAGAVPSPGDGQISTRRSASAGVDERALATGDATRGADVRCRRRRLISRPTPPVEHDCLRLCGRGPPSTHQVA